MKLYVNTDAITKGDGTEERPFQTSAEAMDFNNELTQGVEIIIVGYKPAYYSTGKEIYYLQYRKEFRKYAN